MATPTPTRHAGEPPPSRIPVLRARHTPQTPRSVAGPPGPPSAAAVKTPVNRSASTANEENADGSGSALRRRVKTPAERAVERELDRFLDLDVRDQLAVVRDTISPVVEDRMLAEVAALRGESQPATPVATPTVMRRRERRDGAEAEAEAARVLGWLLDGLYNIHQRPPLSAAQARHIVCRVQVLSRPGGR